MKIELFSECRERQFLLLPIRSAEIDQNIISQLIFIRTLMRGLPHYRTLNFGGGSDWCSATAAARMGTTLLGDKNSVALKSELLLVLGWKFQKLRFRVCLHVKNLLTIFIHLHLMLLGFGLGFS